MEGEESEGLCAWRTGTHPAKHYSEESRGEIKKEKYFVFLCESEDYAQAVLKANQQGPCLQMPFSVMSEQKNRGELSPEE